MWNDMENMAENKENKYEKYERKTGWIVKRYEK